MKVHVQLYKEFTKCDQKHRVRNHLQDHRLKNPKWPTAQEPEEAIGVKGQKLGSSV